MVLVGKLFIGGMQLCFAFIFYAKMYFNATLRIHTRVALLLVMLVQICSSCSWIGIITDCELIKFSQSMEVLVVCLMCYFVIIWILVFCIAIVQRLTEEQGNSFWSVLNTSRSFLISVPDGLLNEINNIWQVEILKNLIVALICTAPRAFTILSIMSVASVFLFKLCLKSEKQFEREFSYSPLPTGVTSAASSQNIITGVIFIALIITAIHITTTVQLTSLIELV